MLGTRAARVILINGSFGVGKTTVARLLRRSLPRSRVYDPELAGFVLQRIGPSLRLRGADSDDFQHMPAWRAATALGTRLSCSATRGPVIVPMAFDEPAYFDEYWSAVLRFAPSSRAFCLVAPLAVVQARIRARGDAPDDPWLARRTRECVQAHKADRFGERVDTSDRSPATVAAEIETRLASC